MVGSSETSMNHVRLPANAAVEAPGLSRRVLSRSYTISCICPLLRFFKFLVCAMTPVRCDSSPRTGERVWQPFVEDKADRVLLLHLTTRSTGIQQSSLSFSPHGLYDIL